VGKESDDTKITKQNHNVVLEGKVRDDVRDPWQTAVSRKAAGALNDILSTSVVKSGDIRRESWQQTLTHLIKASVLPELARTLRTATTARTEPLVPVDKFATILQLFNLSQARALLAGFIADDVSNDTLILDLFAPAAQHLGRLWETDDCDFVQVALAVQNLKVLLQDLPRQPACTTPSPGRILLAPAPGEHHTFGADVAGSLLSERGWDAVVAASGDWEDRLAGEYFDAVGFSISCQACLSGLPQVLRRARAASFHKPIQIIVGGSLVDRQADLVSSVCVDATAGGTAQILFWRQQADSWNASGPRKTFRFTAAKPDFERPISCIARDFRPTVEDSPWLRRRSEHLPAVSGP
jgi:methanogenic corrinoid protein MtbC1